MSCFAGGGGGGGGTLWQAAPRWRTSRAAARAQIQITGRGRIDSIISEAFSRGHGAKGFEDRTVFGGIDGAQVEPEPIRFDASQNGYVPTQERSGQPVGPDAAMSDAECPGVKSFLRAGSAAEERLRREHFQRELRSVCDGVADSGAALLQRGERRPGLAVD